MISSRTRTGLYETLPKTSDASPKGTKSSRPPNKPEHDSSPASHQTGRSSVDGSPRLVDSRPRSVESKPLERRSLKIITPEKRVSKGSELQSQLGILQEDLNKTKELLEKAEAERSQAIEDLKEAKQAAAEANEKLTEALVLQKRAEENCEIEKFRADELEQASIDAAQRIEEKLRLDMYLVKQQHAADVSALLSANQELERVKQELAMVIKAKSSALLGAENATMIAEENAKKVEVLAAELNQMREALKEVRASQMAVCEEKASSDAWWESKAKDASTLVENLSFEVKSLKQELDKAKMVEAKLVETEWRLRLELRDAKNSESNAIDLASEMKKKVESLEVEVEKAKSAEKTANESVVSLLKQLEESNLFLQEAEVEMVSLKGYIESLEVSLGQQRGDLEKSDRQIETAKLEADSMAMAIKSLKSNLGRIEKEKEETLKNEKVMALKIQSLLEEKSKLSDELRRSREEEEKGKNAMDDLALITREVSTETNKAKEDLAATQGQLAEARSQVEDLKLVLQAAEEKHQVMIDDAMMEIDQYKAIAKQNELEFESSKADWDEKELHFLSCIKRSEKEIIALKGESDKLTNSLKAAEVQAGMAREHGIQLQNFLNQVKSELSDARQVAEHATSETLRLQENLRGKEIEIARFARENKELHHRETAALEKIEELSKLLAERTSQKDVKDSKLLTEVKDGLDVPTKAEISGMAAYANIKDHSLEVLMRAEISNETACEKIEENGLEVPMKAEISVETVHENVEEFGLEVPRNAEILGETAYEKVEENGLLLRGKAGISDETPEEKNEENSISVLSSGNLEEQQENIISVSVAPAEVKAESEHGNKNTDENGKDEADLVDVEVAAVKSFKTCDKDSSSKSTMHQSVDEDFDSEMHCDSLNQRHRLAPETVDDGQKHQKKKKALLHKFGGLLKKKHSHK